MRKQIFVKKIVAIIMAFSITVLFSGCENGNNIVDKSNAEKTSIVESSQQGEGSKGNNRRTSDGTNQEESGDLKMLVNGDSSNQTRFEEQGGLYYIFEFKDGASTGWPCIKYVDYNACREVFLCNKLNCMHGDFDCTAILPEEIRQGVSNFTLFGDDNYLYLLMQMDYSSDGMATSEVAPGWESLLEENDSKPDYPPTIYRMKKDGTEREKVYEFDSGVSVEPTIFSDGEDLYLVLIKTKETQDGNVTYFSSYDRQLVRLDLEERNVQKILSMNSWQNIVGCNGRDIIVCERQFEREISEEFKYTNIEEYSELLHNSESVYSSIHIDSGKETIIKKLSNTKEYWDYVVNGYLYITYEKKKGIKKVNLKNGKTQTIKTEKILILDGTVVSVEGQADFMMCWAKGKKEKMPYLVNLETGECVKSTFTNQYQEPIQIISQNDDYLFVISDCEKNKAAGQEHINKNYYSMISKEDYLNNNPDYKSVEMIYNGYTSDIEP